MTYRYIDYGVSYVCVASFHHPRHPGSDQQVTHEQQPSPKLLCMGCLWWGKPATQTRSININNKYSDYDICNVCAAGFHHHRHPNSDYKVTK